MPLLLLFLFFVVFLAVGAPLYMSMLIGVFAYFFSSDISLLVFTQRMLNAVNSFPLLAVPLFMLAGQIMNRGGVTDRIFELAQTIVGRFRGGLGYVNVVASFIFSGMSGSAMADLGGLGVMELRAMKDAGYDDGATIGITAASGTIGPIVPPSLPFVIYGVFANVSVGALFMAGFIPGILMVITLCVMVGLIARRRNYPVGERYGFLAMTRALGKASFALLSPVILIGGIWGGFFTPTEAALASIVWSIFIGVFVYKDLKLRSVPAIIVESFRVVTPVICILIATIPFGWIMVYEGVDKILMEFFTNLTQNVHVMLLMINVLFLLLGMVIDAGAAIMIGVPLLQPLVVSMGIHPVHFGVIVVVNLMIGLLTPPVGMSLYVLAGVTGKPVSVIGKMVAPWLVPLFVALILITYAPVITLFLPRMTGFIY